MYSTRHVTNLAFVLVQFTYITITSLRNKQKTAASARRVTILYGFYGNIQINFWTVYAVVHSEPTHLSFELNPVEQGPQKGCWCLGALPLLARIILPPPVVGGEVKTSTTH